MNVVGATGDGEPAVPPSSAIPAPTAIRMITTTIAQNHHRFQIGLDFEGCSGGGGGGGSGGRSLLPSITRETI